MKLSSRVSRLKPSATLAAAAKGKAFYYTINIDDAMRTTVDEALDIILHMNCRSEVKLAMQLHHVQSE